LKKETGELVWKAATGDQIRCAPTVVEGRVFAAGCDGILHIFDLTNGQETGQVPIQSPTGSTPAAGGDLIFFGTEQAGFKAVNWRKPELAWTALADNPGNSVRGNALVSGQHVVFGTSSRQLISLHPETGAVNWQTTMRSGVESSPVLVDQQRIFVGDGSGRLYEVQLDSGKIVNEISLRGKLLAGPAVGFERLVIASERGIVYCLGQTQPAKSESMLQSPHQ
jgi:outer membrane protein assembly factor BamB